VYFVENEIEDHFVENEIEDHFVSFYLISLNMDEKHDQTVAMLNDENHPPRMRIDDNRTALRKVILRRII
jgi:hypothetical protein